MVIGYSFSDVHINNAIIDAIKGGSLKIFLVDPLGEQEIGLANCRKHTSATTI